MSRTVAHVVGARPNFMKMAPVFDALAALGQPQLLIHTGQHYDEKMSDIFFRELGIPEPDVNLGVGSGSHATQTAALMTGLEATVLEHRPAAMVVYGDVNSTIAAALVCAKLGIPVVHVEAGLRSFDNTMPEEINRRVTDVLADLLLVTSPEAYGHLADEGLAVDRIRLVGNPMIDTLLKHRARFDPAPVKAAAGLPDRVAVSTLHRPANVDDPVVAQQIVDALKQVAKTIDVAIPLHPRGRQQLADLGLVSGEGIHVIDPLGYVDFVSLVSGADLVITDSGGVQEETTILEVPCLTVRPNTERPITITHGTNRLVTPAELAPAAEAVLNGEVDFPTDRPPFWDGRAGQRCAAEIVAFLDRIA
ncbi:MAG TPA: UDP-N-acetylglucosamine 2-epimerase (non-hydrolyzing) [Egicoccus sp.]|nr:UDP-N-acetylglucosamine 2-epimerase (non-hydrolyzing) [Egicoccus sp.]HSK22596.1 UDP-N-acetylglucosamine 2-epimerase (non-hydrolyzing) [Egicoccus sp.]